MINAEVGRGARYFRLRREIPDLPVLDVTLYARNGNHGNRFCEILTNRIAFRTKLFKSPPPKSRKLA